MPYFSFTLLLFACCPFYHSLAPLNKWGQTPPSQLGQHEVPALRLHAPPPSPSTWMCISHGPPPLGQKPFTLSLPSCLVFPELSCRKSTCSSALLMGRFRLWKLIPESLLSGPSQLLLALLLIHYQALPEIILGSHLLPEIKRREQRHPPVRDLRGQKRGFPWMTFTRRRLCLCMSLHRKQVTTADSPLNTIQKAAKQDVKYPILQNE